MTPEDHARREKLREIASCDIRRVELLKDYEAHGFFTVEEFLEWLDIAPAKDNHRSYSREFYRAEAKLHMHIEEMYGVKEFETFICKDDD
jgi:hypothetical protein